MTLTKNDILASLPSLNKADLEQLQAVIGKLLGGSVEPADPLAVDCFDALANALGLSIRLSNLTPALQGKFNKKVVYVINFLNTDFAGWQDNKTKQIKFLRYMFALVKHDLETVIKIQPTPTTMINNLHRMPEIYDSCFPGYRACGLASMVLEHVVGGNKTASKKMARR